MLVGFLCRFVDYLKLQRIDYRHFRSGFLNLILEDRFASAESLIGSVFHSAGNFVAKFPFSLLRFYHAPIIFLFCGARIVFL